MRSCSARLGSYSADGSVEGYVWITIGIGKNEAILRNFYLKTKFGKKRIAVK